MWQAQGSNQSSAVKVTLRPMSAAKENDNVRPLRPEETTQASLTLRVAEVPGQDYPPLGHMSPL